MARSPYPWIIGVGAAGVGLAVALIGGRGPSEAEARQFLTRAAALSRSLPARDAAGAMVALETARIARIDVATCRADAGDQVFGRNPFGAARRQSICRYRITTPEGDVFALALRASRETPGPADRPSGNPLVDGSRRFVGGFRWSPVGADAAARLLAGWD